MNKYMIKYRPVVNGIRGLILDFECDAVSKRVAESVTKTYSSMVHGKNTKCIIVKCKKV